MKLSKLNLKHDNNMFEKALNGNGMTIDLPAKKSSKTVNYAIKLATHLLLRTEILTSLKVDYYDKATAMLNIPMIDGADIALPLSKQAQKIIDEIILETRPNEYLFKEVNSHTGHISNGQLSIIRIQI